MNSANKMLTVEEIKNLETAWKEIVAERHGISTNSLAVTSIFALARTALATLATLEIADLNFKGCQLIVDKIKLERDAYAAKVAELREGLGHILPRVGHNISDLPCAKCEAAQSALSRPAGEAGAEIVEKARKWDELWKTAQDIPGTENRLLLLRNIQERKEAQAKNARMRKALEEIMDYPRYESFSACAMSTLAKAALRGEGKGDSKDE